MSYNRLSGIQAYIVRTATTHTVNGGPTTLRVHHARNARYATYARLYRLGLLVAPHEYADLTDLGADAREQLIKDNNDTRVLTGRAGGSAHVVPQPEPVAEPKPAQPERTDVTYASREASDALMSRIRKLAEAERAASVPAPDRYTVVPVGYDFAVVDRTDGTVVVDGIGSRYAAREDAARRNAEAVPVNWSDLADEPAEWAVKGTLRTAHQDPTPEQQSRFLADVATLWPAGTRVRGMVDGVERTGTVDGVEVWYVTNHSHPNYGRAFVDVKWDAVSPQDMGTGRRSRHFTIDLIRI